MNGENAYRLLQIFRIVLPLTPISLALIALIFLYRKEKTRVTRWMIISTVTWFVLAAFSRIILAWGMQISEIAPNSADRNMIYFYAADFSWDLENVAFICFATLLLKYFRTSLSGRSVDEG
jgi:hypothetical protein